MSSLLTFQLHQQQKQEAHHSQSSLPSPPNSFCGDESSSNNNTNNTFADNKTQLLSSAILADKRRGSLQTVFNDMSIKDYSTSLPENYTIDHSSLSNTTTVTTPTSNIRRSSHAPIATATAAATGGLAIRNRKQPEAVSGSPLSNSSSSRRRGTSRGLSESFSGQYRCNDCGKSYKHPNCLQKHRWEHSEEWELTKKLPLTKHQQVQILEAAAILVSMDRPQADMEDIQQQEFTFNEEEDAEGDIKIEDNNSDFTLEDKDELLEEEEEEDDDDEDDDEESIVIDDDDNDEKIGPLSSSYSSSIVMDDL